MIVRVAHASSAIFDYYHWCNLLMLIILQFAIVTRFPSDNTTVLCCLSSTARRQLKAAVESGWEFKKLNY